MESVLGLGARAQLSQIEVLLWPAAPGAGELEQYRFSVETAGGEVLASVHCQLRRDGTLAAFGETLVLDPALPVGIAEQMRLRTRRERGSSGCACRVSVCAVGRLVDGNEVIVLARTRDVDIAADQEGCDWPFESLTWEGPARAANHSVAALPEARQTDAGAA